MGAAHGQDIVNAGAGNDIILGSTGDDLIDGGEGIDKLTYAPLEAGVSVKFEDIEGVLYEEKIVIEGDDFEDFAYGIEQLSLTVYDDKVFITDNDLNRSIEIDAHGEGESGDTVDFSAVTSGIVVNAGVADTNIMLENFENFIGTAFNDRFIDKQGVENAYIGGDGLDVIDYSLWSVEEGITVNLNDFEEDSDGNTLSSIEGVIGTDKDDLFIDNPNMDNFIGGGDGVDTIDYSMRTSGIFVKVNYDFEFYEDSGETQGDGQFIREWQVVHTYYDDNDEPTEHVYAYVYETDDNYMMVGTENRFVSAEKFIGTGYDDWFVGGAWASHIDGGDGFDVIDGYGGIINLAERQFGYSEGYYNEDLLWVETGRVATGSFTNIEGFLNVEFEINWGNPQDWVLHATYGNAVYYDSRTGYYEMIFKYRLTDGGAGLPDGFREAEVVVFDSNGDIIERVGLSAQPEDRQLYNFTFWGMGSSGDDVLIGDRNGDHARDDKMYGGSGDDTLHGGNGNDILEGGNGNDVLNGGTGNDILDGGAGGDILNGGSGNDGYKFRRGDGNNEINEEGGTDEIIIDDSSISLADINISRVGDDLSIQIASGFLIKDFFAGNPDRVVEQIRFIDNSTIDLSAFALSAPVITSNGYGDNAEIMISEGALFVTTVTAFDLEDAVLTYSIYGGADFNLFSIDSVTGELSFLLVPYYSMPTDSDFDNIYEVQVQVSDGAFSDLQSIYVTVADSGVNVSPVAYDDYLSGDEDNVIYGNVLDDNGNGYDFDPNGDFLTTVQSGIFSTALGNFIEFDGYGGFTFTPSENFNGQDFYNYTLVDPYDGESQAIIYFEIIPVQDAPIAMDDNITAYVDTLYEGNLLADNGNGYDSDVDGDNLAVVAGVYTTVQGGSVTVHSDGTFEYFAPEGYAGSDSFTYTLEDGLDTDDAQVFISVVPAPIYGTSDPDSLFGGVHGDTIYAYGSGDYIYASLGGDTIYAGDGDDYYIYTPYSEDRDYILYAGDKYYGGNGFDTLDIGITKSQYSRQLGDDYLTLLNLIENDLTPLDGVDYVFNSIDLAVFSIENVTISMVDYSDEYNPIPIALSFVPEAVDDYISVIKDASKNGNVFTDNGKGADYSFGTLSVVSPGIYSTSQGGSLHIFSNGNFTYTPPAAFSGTDTYEYVATDLSGELTEATIYFNVMTEVIGTSGNDLIDYSLSSYPVHITGLDGDDHITGSAYNDFIDGGLGEDIIYGGSGNDIIRDYGAYDPNQIYGGDGDDYIENWASNSIVSGGNGDDRIYASGINTIIIAGAGNDYIIANDGSTYDAFDAPDGINIVLDHPYFYNRDMVLGGGADGYGDIDWFTNIHKVRGSEDGNNVIVAMEPVEIDYLLLPHVMNYTIETFNGDDYISLADGNDTISAGNGTNMVFAGGGNDIVTGGSDTDHLDGGDGDDILYGNGGYDYLTGGAGEDTFVFLDSAAFTGMTNIVDFNISDGDKLDISDVISGYDPMTDLITDFVRMDINYTDTEMFIDRDGAGTVHSWTQIAILANIAGLTDEAALVTNGHLIVA